MNKRITSLLLCFVMVFSLSFTALPVFAVPGKTTTLTARPDKATASPGETITYTVTLGAVEDLLGIKFKLIIPEGLTFVTGAEKAGVKEALGATSAEFTPSTKVFLARQQAAPRNAILQHIHRIIRVMLPRRTLLSVLSVDMSLKHSSVIPTM